ncbi:hypothetical protein [Pseudorhodoferax sp. Leaf274]|uniref:hypothetical protein n=1 Tax=Pseudorhodoferax sp. Leaf274 TaxID=1736318 RepID=UPI000ABD0833|nr:hypothetical protein [Pseudorhodoferax sp. Leaf274]
MPADRSPQREDALAGLKYGLLLGCAVLALVLPPAGHRQSAAAAISPPFPSSAVLTRAAPEALQAPRLADLRGKEASEAVRRVADWATDSGDNQGLHFVVLDKRNAKVFLFRPDGTLRAATPVLLGSAPGDLTVDGVGGKPIHAVLPEERTTPAGRFVAQPGRNTTPEDVVWVDYAAAVSMHRVRATDPRERRLERLASPSVEDNRISYGCINMPVAFFEQELWPVFQAARGIVYVLPEVLPLQQVFAGLYDPVARHAASLR